MSALPNRYWDSCAFLAWLAEEQDKIEECRTVIEAAKNGRLVIVTSALTLAEVVKLKPKKAILKHEEAKLTDFFKNPYIEVRQVTRRIGELARDLVWDFGIDPKDAIHVATAVNENLQYLDTFDGPLIKKTRTIGSPPITIARPNLPGEAKLFSD